MVTINIKEDYTDTPGFRYPKDGDYSGEEFRKRFLEPLFADPDNEDEITVILDGVYGYATSFLEESFGGLARMYGRDRVRRRFKFVSDEEPVLIEEIIGYIDNCDG